MEKNNNIGVLAHILGIVAGFIGPLIVYLTLQEKSGKNYENTKNALNFQLSLIIYYIVSAILCLILIGFVLLAALSVVNLVTSIMGAVKASNGEVYKYPMTISFIK